MFFLLRDLSVASSVSKHGPIVLNLIKNELINYAVTLALLK